MPIVMAPLCAVAALDAASLRARIGVIVFAAGLCSMLTVSVTYHRWVHTIRARAAWRRADHATIFVAIAATSTPLCLTVGPESSAGLRLLVVWTSAALGVAAKATANRRRHTRVRRSDTRRRGDQRGHDDVERRTRATHGRRRRALWTYIGFASA